MRLAQAKEMCEALMAEHLTEYKGWTFEWTNSVRTFGVCYYKKRVIALSKALVQMNDEARVKRVILHELAHALAGSKAGHGKAWRQHCLALGGDGDRLWHESDTIPVPPKYIGTCPNGHTNRKYRATRTKQSCGKCSPVYDERYLITYKRVVQ